MVNIFHGEDVAASRNALPKRAVKIDGETATAEMLVQLLEGKSLFEAENAVVIENPKNPPPGLPSDADIIVWFDHKLTPNQIKAYHGAHVQEFKLNEIVFKFVESLRPGNQRETLPFFEKFSSQEFSEVIFSMIIRQFRLMLNPQELSGWQKDRIVNQSRQFTTKQLKTVYKKLLNIDYLQKSGQAVSDLKGSLELFLLTL